MNESKKVLNKLLGFMTRFVTIAAQANVQTKISENFYKTEIQNLFKKIQSETDKEFWDNAFDLSIEDKHLLGFRKYNKNESKMLIPLWIVECLPDNYEKEVTTIFGNAVILSNKVEDKDTKFGCTCYMV